MAKLAKAIKDTDYLYASARVKSIEKNLLSRDRLERMIDAKSLEDALKFLSESGWPEIADYTMAAVEGVLTDRRSEAFSLIRGLAPDRRLSDIFLIKYDYHNLKAILKSEVTGEETDDLLIDNGIFTCRQLKAMLQESNFAGMGETMAASLVEARDVLARTQDPQLLDLILDKAMYADMLAMADLFGSAFLKNYVALMIDSANLRMVVRLQHMGKGRDTPPRADPRRRRHRFPIIGGYNRRRHRKCVRRDDAGCRGWRGREGASGGRKPSGAGSELRQRAPQIYKSGKIRRIRRRAADRVSGGCRS